VAGAALAVLVGTLTRRPGAPPLTKQVIGHLADFPQQSPFWVTLDADPSAKIGSEFFRNTQRRFEGANG
jgi:hypothetical protein